MKAKNLWNYKHDESILGLASGDINGDGKPELLAFSKDGYLFIFSLEGELIFKDIITDGSSIWHLKVRHNDINGKTEVIVGGLDGLLRVFKFNAEKKQLEPSWAHQFGASISGILIADINNDGKDNIIACSLDKSIRVLNADDGSLIWGQVFEDGVGDAMIYQSSPPELVACGNDGTLRVYNGIKGELLWFKRFPDKIRCLALMDSKDRPFLACGGDDKSIHFIDYKTQAEIRSIQFNEYIWKVLSFPGSIRNRILVSTYSFNYLMEDFDGFNDNSKITCYNEDFEEIWEITRKNTEYMEYIENNEQKFIIISTTEGEILLINPLDGKAMIKLETPSCTNMTRTLLDSKLIFSCHDNGEINGFLF